MAVINPGESGSVKPSRGFNVDVFALFRKD